MANPTATSGKSSIDTKYLSKVEDESSVHDENGTSLGVVGKTGLPGPLYKNEIQIASGLKLMGIEEI